VVLAQAADLDLQVGVDPGRLVDRFSRAVFETIEALCQVATSVAVVGLT
jgi:hypothetical protein